MESGFNVLDAILREVRAGRAVALCAIVATRGSTPQPAGAMLCVDQAAQITGTLGGGCVEADIRRRGHHLISSGRSELVTFALVSDFGFDEGMICGGHMDIAVDVLTPSSDIEPYRQALEQLRAGQTATIPVRAEAEHRPVQYRVHVEAAPELVIAGAGHIGRVLAGMMAPLGFRVHIVDDRAEYANAERFPPPIRITVGDIASTLERFPVNASTYLVIVTRGHKHDERSLQAVLNSPAKYIGMIGSRRKVEVIFNDLRNGGASEVQLDRVHAPIGLKLNAVTTEEIALSIAAELVSVRRVDNYDAVDGPIPLYQGME
jgi:xanthine dehydrogenase accessory factor